MEKLEKVIVGLKELRAHFRAMASISSSSQGMKAHMESARIIDDAIALLKAQEAVRPTLARGWYWCGGVGCRNSLTSALENDIPARKPNYCERCGRAVKWRG